MAVTVATQRRVTINPRLTEADFDYGPLASVLANQVLLTREYLAKLGLPPLRSGADWAVELQLLDVISGTETAHDLTGVTALTITLYDPQSYVYVDAWTKDSEITIDATPTTGKLVLALADDDTVVVGRHALLLEVTYAGGEVVEWASGLIDIHPAKPSA